MDKININISLLQGRKIHRALAELPFKIVYELIGSINKQVNEQNSSFIKKENVILKLRMDDLKLIIKALGQYPYNEVADIIEVISEKLNDLVVKNN